LAFTAAAKLYRLLKAGELGKVVSAV